MKFPLYFVSCILNSFINQCHTVVPETVWGLHREELPPVERAGYRKTRRGVNPSQCSPSASMFCIYKPLEVRFFACLIDKNLKHVFDLEKIFINFCYLQLILVYFHDLCSSHERFMRNQKWRKNLQCHIGHTTWSGLNHLWHLQKLVQEER